MFYRKSKLPPFNIEPFPHERERLPFKMTVVDRALREQWVKDQHLSPNEPRHVPEIFPKNVFRRMYGTPWNFVATKLSTSGLTSEGGAAVFRFFTPKLAMYFVGVSFIYSYFKNNQTSWEQNTGWNIFANRLQVYPGQDPEEVQKKAVRIELIPRDYHDKHCGEFADLGFMNRKSHLSLD